MEVHIEFTGKNGNGVAAVELSAVGSVYLVSKLLSIGMNDHRVRVRSGWDFGYPLDYKPLGGVKQQQRKRRH